MKISSEKFLRLSLFFPYVFGVLLFCLATIIDPSMDSNSSILLQVVSVPIALVYIVYFFGALYWLVPYTLLAVFLWIWSLKKDKLQIYKMFIKAPFLLGILIVIFSAVLSQFNISEFFTMELAMGISLLCAFPFSLFFGYVFIGFVAWIYEYVEKRGFVVDKELLILGETNS